MKLQCVRLRSGEVTVEGRALPTAGGAVRFGEARTPAGAAGARLAGYLLELEACGAARIYDAQPALAQLLSDLRTACPALGAFVEVAPPRWGDFGLSDDMWSAEHSALLLYSACVTLQKQQI